MKPVWWQALLLVGAGGFAGAISRYLVALAVGRWHTSDFPWGTFAANALGCLAIGAVLAFLDRSESLRLLLVTGFLGSLTTFSTVSFDTLSLIRKGQMGLGLANIGLSVVIGLFAAWLGYALVSAART